MKYLKILSLAAVVTLGTLAISSCGPGDDAKPQPVITFDAGDDYISTDMGLAANRAFKISVSANHTVNMTTMEVSVSYNGGPAEAPTNCDICDTTINARTFTGVISATTKGSAGTEVWTVTVRDAEGQMATKTLTITNLGSDFAQALDFLQDNQGNPFKVYHINFQAGAYSAYQMGVGNIRSNEPEAWKDIKDSTLASEYQNWPGRWTSGNGTQFKKVTNYSWGNFKFNNELVDAFNKSTAASQTIVLPQDGDLFLAKLSNGKVAMIEITDVNKTTTGDADYIQFTYKYAP